MNYNPPLIKVAVFHFIAKKLYAKIPQYEKKLLEKKSDTIKDIPKEYLNCMNKIMIHPITINNKNYDLEDFKVTKENDTHKFATHPDIEGPVDIKYAEKNEKLCEEMKNYIVKNWKVKFNPLCVENLKLAPYIKIVNFIAAQKNNIMIDIEAIMEAYFKMVCAFNLIKKDFPDEKSKYDMVYNVTINVAELCVRNIFIDKKINTIDSMTPYCINKEYCDSNYNYLIIRHKMFHLKFRGSHGAGFKTKHPLLIILTIYKITNERAYLYAYEQYINSNYDIDMHRYVLTLAIRNKILFVIKRFIKYAIFYHKKMIYGNYEFIDVTRKALTPLGINEFWKMGIKKFSSIHLIDNPAFEKQCKFMLTNMQKLIKLPICIINRLVEKYPFNNEKIVEFAKNVKTRKSQMVIDHINDIFLCKFE